jgi:hypothetical protein
MVKFLSQNDLDPKSEKENQAFVDAESILIVSRISEVFLRILTVSSQEVCPKNTQTQLQEIALNREI